MLNIPYGRLRREKSELAGIGIHECMVLPTFSCDVGFVGCSLLAIVGKSQIVLSGFRLLGKQRSFKLQENFI